MKDQPRRYKWSLFHHGKLYQLTKCDLLKNYYTVNNRKIYPLKSNKTVQYLHALYFFTMKYSFKLKYPNCVVLSQA